MKSVSELLKTPMSAAKFRQTYNRLSVHELDLLIACPNRDCLAKEGKECKGLSRGVVHFGRRLYRLMKLPKAPIV